MNNSKHNDKSELGQSQASQPEPHLADVHARVPLDGYVIVHRQILDEGFSAYELSFLVACLLVADHRKTKTPGVVAKSTTELGRLMGASQKRAWKCKRGLIARGIIKPLGGHKFIIVNYENYQNLVQTFLVPQTKDTTKKGHNFSPTDLSLVPQTNGLVPQTNDKSHRLMVSPTNYSLGTNQAQVLNNQISKSIKEVKGGPSSQGLVAQTPASKYLFEKTGRKRWQNLVQKEQFEKAEFAVGEERMKEAINWALTSGISNIKSIITAAKKGGSHHDAEATSPPQRPQTHRGESPAYHQTTDEERRRAIT